MLIAPITKRAGWAFGRMLVLWRQGTSRLFLEKESRTETSTPTAQCGDFEHCAFVIRHGCVCWLPRLRRVATSAAFLRTGYRGHCAESQNAMSRSVGTADSCLDYRVCLQVFTKSFSYLWMVRWPGPPGCLTLLLMPFPRPVRRDSATYVPNDSRYWAAAPKSKKYMYELFASDFACPAPAQVDLATVWGSLESSPLGRPETS